MKLQMTMLDNGRVIILVPLKLVNNSQLRRYDFLVDNPARNNCKTCTSKLSTGELEYLQGLAIARVLLCVPSEIENETTDQPLCWFCLLCAYF